MKCEHEWESVLYSPNEDWASPYESICKHCDILECDSSVEVEQ